MCVCVDNKRQRKEGKIPKNRAGKWFLKSLEGGVGKLWMTEERPACERELTENDETESGKETNGMGTEWRRSLGGQSFISFSTSNSKSV